MHPELDVVGSLGSDCPVNEPEQKVRLVCLASLRGEAIERDVVDSITDSVFADHLEAHDRDGDEVECGIAGGGEVIVDHPAQVAVDLEKVAGVPVPMNDVMTCERVGIEPVASVSMRSIRSAVRRTWLRRGSWRQ